MRGPELHTLLVTRPDPLSPTPGRSAGAAGAGPVTVGDPSGGHMGPAIEPRRQLASGGYQVHNGRPVAPVVVG